MRVAAEQTRQPFAKEGPRVHHRLVSRAASSDARQFIAAGRPGYVHGHKVGEGFVVTARLQVSP